MCAGRERYCGPICHNRHSAAHDRSAADTQAKEPSFCCLTPLRELLPEGSKISPIGGELPAFAPTASQCDEKAKGCPQLVAAVPSSSQDINRLDRVGETAVAYAQRTCRGIDAAPAYRSPRGTALPEGPHRRRLMSVRRYEHIRRKLNLDCRRALLGRSSDKSSGHLIHLPVAEQRGLPCCCNTGQEWQNPETHQQLPHRESSSRQRSEPTLPKFPIVVDEDRPCGRLEQ